MNYRSLLDCFLFVALVIEEETTRREEKERELEYQAYIQKLEELAKIRDRVWEQVFKAISLK